MPSLTLAQQRDRYGPGSQSSLPITPEGTALPSSPFPRLTCSQEHCCGGRGVASDGDGGVSLYGWCLHTCMFKPTYMYSHMHPQTYTQAHAHTHHALAGSEAPSTLLNTSFRREMASMNKICVLVKEGGGRVRGAAVSLSHEFTAEDSACGEGRRNREHQAPPPLTPTPTSRAGTADFCLKS